MTSLSFDEARTKLDTVFDLVAAGELVVIARKDQRVALHSLQAQNDPAVAPPGYFANDYDPAEINELNSLASKGPQRPI